MQEMGGWELRAGRGAWQRPSDPDAADFPATTGHCDEDNHDNDENKKGGIY